MVASTFQQSAAQMALSDVEKAALQGFFSRPAPSLACTFTFWVHVCECVRTCAVWSTRPTRGVSAWGSMNRISSVGMQWQQSAIVTACQYAWQ